MRGLLCYPDFANLSTRLFMPFTYKEYAELKNTIQVEHIQNNKDNHSRIDAVHILGKKARIGKLDCLFDTIPDIRLYMASDAYSYNNIFFSQCGNALLDNFRFYHQDKDRRNQTFSFPAQFKPLDLGNGYYSHKSIRNIKNIKLVDELSLPFFTYDRYGHYLIDSLPRLWVTQYGYKPKLILYDSLKQIPDYLLSMVKPFGLDESSFIFPSDVTFYKKLLMTTHPAMNGRYYSSVAQSIFKIITDYYTNEEDGLTPERIYVSRSDSYGRTLVNNHECEELFRSLGFTIFYPENHSFPRQVRVFAKATHIAGESCSGLHNVVFSKSPDMLKVLPIMPSDFGSIRAYVKLDSAFSRKSYCFFGSKIKTDASNNQSWSLDIDDLKYATDQWLYDF